MIPMSDIWCLACGQRYPADGNPPYCGNTILTPGDVVERACPGPLIQVFVADPPPPTLSEALAS